MKKRTQRENLRLKGGLRKIKKSPKNEIILVLDNIKSMYNVGAIFRTCEAIKAKKIILCGITATPPRDKIYKTSMGTVDMVEWEYFKDSAEAINALKKDNYQIVSLEQTDQSINFKKAKYRFPVAVVVGHEKNGVSKKVLDLSDISVEIPMLGQANSLNVATATGIILYEVLNQK